MASKANWLSSLSSMAYPNLPRLTYQTAASDYRPPVGALYLYGASSELRSGHIAAWQSNSRDVTFVELISTSAADALARVGDVTSTVSLRSKSSLQELLSSASGRPVCVDITGLPHHIWAPVLRVLIEDVDSSDIIAIYAEPAQYTRTASVHSKLFKLSESLEGIAPLPGFAALASEDDGAMVIPMLGFEGSRFRHLISELEPAEDRIVPVVGVPGFQHPFPMYSFLGNHVALEEEIRFRKIEFARSNCVFDAAIRLLQIGTDNPNSRLQIAPIGTKPHALAAILFAIANPALTEIVYDHPVRSSDRTAGTGSLCVYPLSGFVNALVLQ